jgi:hypothetical protein
MMTLWGYPGRVLHIIETNDGVICWVEGTESGISGDVTQESRGETDF